MILLAGGDSFIFGAELADQIGDVPSLSTYPAQLAKKNSMDYICVARSGNANNAITRMICNGIEANKDRIAEIGVLVTWTFSNRYEFRFNYHTRQKTTPWFSINAWSTLNNIDVIENEFHNKNPDALNQHKLALQRAKETGIHDFAKVWYKHVGDSEYYELYSSLKEILFMQNYLKQNNIPYLFTAADNHFYNHDNYHRQKDQNIDAFYNQIDWAKWFFFEAGTGPDQTKELRGFYQWAIENKYPVGTTHPLEEAHINAAKLIKEKFDELVKNPLEQNSARN